MPTATAVADLDPQLNTQITQLQQQANKQQQAILTGQQAQWLIPALSGWTGDLFDWTGMAEPFSRQVSNNAFVQAVSSAQSPGTSGDLVVTTLQADYLAIMERSFRDRHTMRRPRAVSHAMGRKAGHGNTKGPLVQCVIEFINGLVKASKS